jgi:4-hydroxybenzoate polyprenyltransferase
MNMEQINPVLSHFNFALLVLSTVLVAAAGNAINDYFDLRIDRINKSKRIIVGKYFSRRKVMTLHTVLSIIAIILGTWVSYKAGALKLATINIVMVALLWMYSVKYKAYFLVGNLLIAFATSMTIIVVWLFDTVSINHVGLFLIPDLHYLLNLLIWIYIGFAFVISIIREIIKDIEDIEGDKKVGCSTIPVVIGIAKTKFVLVALTGLSLLAIVYIEYKVFVYFGINFLFCYIVFAVILPFIYLAYATIRTKVKEDFSFLSKVTKYLMLAGVLSMIFIKETLIFH